MRSACLGDDDMNQDATDVDVQSDPIDFAVRFANSETFRNLFREGMGLVEETASYLDGPGRTDSKELGRAGSLVYATESMRLTTRLMQLASWLLLQRAVNEGEMTQAQAGIEKSKVRIDGPSSSRDGPGWDDVPDALKHLIERSIRLQERIRKLDKAIYQEDKPDTVAVNPVAAQVDRLTDAFGGLSR
jgi:regulator of CtrA degradation